MAKISFFGAVGTVTGSRHLLETDGLKLLIDCGMFQGLKENRLKNWEDFPIDPASIDHIFLTHAHIDHSGYLPRLYRQGFRGKIHATHATRDLCEIMLKDSAHLQEEDAKWANKRGYSKHKPALPLYTAKDAENTIKLFKPHYYGEDVFLNDRLRIKFKDAGHILGSSFIDIKRVAGKESKRILFSGDFGRPDRPILREPVQVYNVDYLIVESTYGDRLHDDADPKEELLRVINDSYGRKGVLVIPAFSVGRTQTLLYAIRELEEKKKIPEMSIFVDSPMAINATEVFKNRIHDLNLSARKKDIEGVDIFSPKNLHICKTRDESKEINKVKGGAIIISASGMATGGRILHHLAERIPDRRNTVLFIGYQAQGTRGRTLLDGKNEVKIHGRKIAVNAKIENISGFSGHGDYDEIVAWLSAFNITPQKTFIVHGEENASEAMAERIRSRFAWDVIVPQFADNFELDF